MSIQHFINVYWKYPKLVPLDSRRETWDTSLLTGSSNVLTYDWIVLQVEPQPLWTCATTSTALCRGGPETTAATRRRRRRRPSTWWDSTRRRCWRVRRSTARGRQRGGVTTASRSTRLTGTPGTPGVADSPSRVSSWRMTARGSARTARRASSPGPSGSSSSVSP